MNTAFFKELSVNTWLSLLTIYNIDFLVLGNMFCEILCKHYISLTYFPFLKKMYMKKICLKMATEMLLWGVLSYWVYFPKGQVYFCEDGGITPRLR